MYHLTPTEYDRALTRAYKDRAEARPPEGLDTDRLAEAIRATRDLWFGGDRDAWWMAEPEGMAKDIAAEYARLSAGGATKP